MIDVALSDSDAFVRELAAKPSEAESLAARLIQQLQTRPPEEHGGIVYEYAQVINNIDALHDRLEYVLDAFGYVVGNYLENDTKLQAWRKERKCTFDVWLQDAGLVEFGDIYRKAREKRKYKAPKLERIKRAWPDLDEEAWIKASSEPSLERLGRLADEGLPLSRVKELINTAVFQRLRDRHELCERKGYVESYLTDSLMPTQRDYDRFLLPARGQGRSRRWTIKEDFELSTRDELQFDLPRRPLRVAQDGLLEDGRIESLVRTPKAPKTPIARSKAAANSLLTPTSTLKRPSQISETPQLQATKQQKPSNKRPKVNNHTGPVRTSRSPLNRGFVEITRASPSPSSSSDDAEEEIAEAVDGSSSEDSRHSTPSSPASLSVVQQQQQYSSSSQEEIDPEAAASDTTQADTSSREQTEALEHQSVGTCNNEVDHELSPQPPSPDRLSNGSSRDKTAAQILLVMGGAWSDDHHRPSSSNQDTLDFMDTDAFVGSNAALFGRLEELGALLKQENDSVSLLPVAAQIIAELDNAALSGEQRTDDTSEHERRRRIFLALTVWFSIYRIK